MIKRDITIGIVGCGRVAQHYRHIFESGAVDNFQIVACCDSDLKKAQKLSKPLKSNAFQDMELMLDTAKPDLVIILTPSGDHFAHARLALEKNHHVLVEKPICLIPEQALELEDIARKRNLMLGVAFQNRFNPSVQHLNAAMQEGRFGRRVTASIRLRWCRQQNYYEDGWHGTWQQDGGVINQQAIHHVDCINWLCGPIEAVCAEESNRLNQLEAEDTLVAILRFADGSLGTIEATTAARPEDFEASLSLVGEKGMAQIGGIALNKIDTWAFVEPRKEDAEVPARYSQTVSNGYGVGHGALLSKTIERLRRGSSEAPISTSDGLGAVRLVHALYASIERGGWVRLDEHPISNRLGKPQE
jgi:UDP-N-acetyl-2-amino-2-deoxyglucuronate dehydrogenase